MAKKVIIVGAVALGPKVASRLRRLDPEADILLIDRDDKISYGGCGMPYYIGGDVNDIEDLYSTTAHVIRDKDFFQNYKRIRVMTRVEATRIDRREHSLIVRHLDSGEEQVLEYDKLVLATGAMAVKPPVPGVELDGVFTVSDLHDAERIKSLMTQGKVGSAVVYRRRGDRPGNGRGFDRPVGHWHDTCGDGGSGTAHAPGQMYCQGC